MARRPAHFCTCGSVIPAGDRCACKRVGDALRKRRHDQNRPSARQRGYTAEWQKERATFLHMNPSCARCTKPATVVDHIVPHKGDAFLFWKKANWQALCTRCHNSAKQREERASLFSCKAVR